MRLQKVVFVTFVLSFITTCDLHAQVAVPPYYDNVYDHYGFDYANYIMGYFPPSHSRLGGLVAG